jgi:hypothetical protein
MAMQDRVPMETAHAFARTFYERLLEHGRIDLATNEGRGTLISGRAPGFRLPGYAIPCLFMRLENGCLFEPEPSTLVPVRFGRGPKPASPGPFEGMAADSLAIHCDRTGQWSALERRAAAPCDDLAFLAGTLNQGHRFFGGRVYNMWSLQHEADWLTVTLQTKPDRDARLEHLCERLEERLGWTRDLRKAPADRLVECFSGCVTQLERRVIALIHERLPLGRALEQEECVTELWRYYQAVALAARQARQALGAVDRRPIVKCVQSVGWPRTSASAMPPSGVRKSEQRRLEDSLAGYAKQNPAQLLAVEPGDGAGGPMWLPLLEDIRPDDILELYRTRQSEYHLLPGQEAAFLEEAMLDAMHSDEILCRIDELKGKYEAR